MEKSENSLPKQGIDGCTFSIESKWYYKPLVNEILLKSPNGTVFGTLKQVGVDYVLFVCPPKYVRDTNEYPFGISDLPYLDDMRKEIERVLKKEFPKGYYLKATKIEVNLTDTMVGKCQCENIFSLFCDSLLHTKDQNILYVTQSKESHIDKEIPGFVSRTIGNQWKLKCYDKQKQLDVEMDIQISEPLIRMEFILLSRKIQNLFGKKHSLNTIFSQAGVMLLINEYKSLMDNLTENYVKKHLSLVHKQLLADLREYGRPTDVYCLRKQNIHDKIQMQKALKAFYKEQNRDDISNQVLYGLNKKFGLPCNTIDTIRKFHKQC